MYIQNNKIEIFFIFYFLCIPIKSDYFVKVDMSIKQLFIPSVLADFSATELFDLFYTYQLATISQIYYIPIEFQGKLYNDLYITIQNWHKSENATDFIKRLRRSFARKSFATLLIYDNPLRDNPLRDDLLSQVYILNILNDAIPSYGYLLTNPNYLKKQLLINKLLNNKKCFELQDNIKGYLFVDSIYSEAHITKKSLILNFKQVLTRLPDDGDGYWRLSYGYENIQLAAEQCLTCGGFKFTEEPKNVAPRALCNCPGFREYYLQYLNDTFNPF